MRFTPLGLSILLTASALGQGLISTAGGGGEVTIRAADGQGDAELDLQTQIATAANGVVVTYGTATLTARKIQLDMANTSVLAEGDVSLQRIGPDGRAVLWRGERIRYNYANETLSADDFRFGQPPFFAAGHHLEGGKTNAVQTAVDAILTTDDVADPDYRIKARRITIGQDRTITAKEATAVVGGVPVMYFPTYSRTLTEHKFFWTAMPGYRSTWGAFALGAYHQNWNTNVQTSIELDYYSKHGPGVGPSVEYDLGRWGKGQGTFYYVHDRDPGVDQFGQPNPTNRERLALSHQANPWEDFYATGALWQQGDPDIIRDFFQNEYRQNTPQPLTYFEAEKLWSNFSLGVLVTPQVNSFQPAVERLPELFLNGARQQLGPTPLYYDSQSSIGYYRFSNGDYSNLIYEAFRADTYHQLTLPKTFFGFLNVIPRAGGRYTHYGEPEGLETITTPGNRWIFNTGGEVTWKASATWKGVQSDLWDLNGLRHVIQPSFNYAYIPTPNLLPRQVPQFDYRVPSFELRPIEFPDDNSIDTLGYRNVIRLSLLNLLETKREGTIQDFVNWQLYTDWNLDKQESFETTFSDVYSRLMFQPKTWVSFGSLVRFDVEDGRLNEFDNAIRFTPNDVWSWTFANRYLREDPNLANDASNTFFSTIGYRMNEDWSLRMSHQFEAATGTMQAQYYTLAKDFRSWVGAITVQILDNGPNGIDWTVGVGFQLKASPNPSQQDRTTGPNRLLEPWIF
ncbi:MAG: LPS assembly protein LptD [Verrucomicrobiota bacterium]